MTCDNDKAGVVHQLYSVGTPQHRMGHVEAMAKCGATARYRLADSLPPTMSGYNSRVTCPLCLNQGLRESLERWYSVFGKASVRHALEEAASKARSGRRGGPMPRTGIGTHVGAHAHV